LCTSRDCAGARNDSIRKTDFCFTKYVCAVSGEQHDEYPHVSSSSNRAGAHPHWRHLESILHMMLQGASGHSVVPTVQAFKPRGSCATAVASQLRQSRLTASRTDTNRPVDLRRIA
jgi:hypothetical protein